ncbi:hypothetical protein MHU86_17802 [Fragilaria crotonensis]|nr:hypothetical protein MHU86_17802 [Fragilaria crotonensis]
MDIGYWADDEYDAEQWDYDNTQSREDDTCDERERRGQQLFFADLPSRTKRPINNNVVRRQRCTSQVSQYTQARWLSHYFWNQNTSAQRTLGIFPPAISDSESMNEQTLSTETRAEGGAPKLVASCHHIPLEESISFSTRPRVVVEADTPHRVVHTNGAYELYFGYSSRLAASSFQAQNVRSLEDFETSVVRALFDPSKAGSQSILIMYPVLGAERNGSVPIVTHYLIEASNCTLLPPKSRGQWRGAGAQVIA